MSDRPAAHRASAPISDAMIKAGRLRNTTSAFLGGEMAKWFRVDNNALIAVLSSPSKWGRPEPGLSDCTTAASMRHAHLV